MTSRLTSSRDRLVLALLSAIAVSILGWLLVRPTPPPEPIYKGHPLSWWLADGRTITDPTRDGSEDLDALRALGPGAVRWLAYTAEHGHVGRSMPPSMISQLWENILGGIRYRIDPNWQPRPEPWEGTGAFMELRNLGEDAAPAIPTLVRIIERSDERDLLRNERVWRATSALAAIGSPALPEHLRLIKTRPPKIRDLLIMDLAMRADTQALTDSERTQVLDVFMSVCNDPNGEVREHVLYALIRFCERHGFRPEMRPAIPAIIDFVTGKGVPPDWLFQFASGFKQEAAAAIPRLVERLDDSNSNAADFAALALTQIDPTDKRVIPRMRGLLSCKNTQYEEIARKTLKSFGELPEPSGLPLLPTIDR